MTFPQFRKYPHNKTFFKINSASDFDELQILGNTFSLTKLVAKILPDRNYINDMLCNTNEYWVLSNEEEFTERLNFCKYNLKEC